MAEIAIVGAGAVGRVLASVLTLEGHDVTLFARQNTATQLKDARTEDGFLFESPALEAPVPVDFKVRATDSDCGQSFDTVIYAVKAPYVEQAVANTAHLMNDDNTVVFAQGGLQWWTGYAHDAIDSAVTDPDQRIAHHIDMNNLISMLVSFGASLDDSNPALIRHSGGNKVRLGQPFGAQADRLADTQALLGEQFLDVGTEAHVFETLWNKAAGSFAMSSYALITQQTLGEMTSDANVLDQMVRCADTLKAAGARMGLTCDIDYTDYLETMGRNLPNHKMSILKDSSESHYILNLPAQIAKSVGVDVQMLEDVCARCDEIIAPDAPDTHAASTPDNAPTLKPE